MHMEYHTMMCDQAISGNGIPAWMAGVAQEELGDMPLSSRP